MEESTVKKGLNPHSKIDTLPSLSTEVNEEAGKPF